MNIFFRLEANKNIGYGHLYRCLYLSRGLLKINNKLNFFFLLETLSKDEKKIFLNFKNIKIINIKESFKKEVKVILKLIKNYKPVILIVDSYDINFNWEKKYSNNVKILAIDDLANRKHISDYLLDYSLNRNTENYSKLINKNSLNFLGSDFFLYDKNIPSYRKKSFNNQILCKTKTCIINFGGADNNNLLFSIVKNILRYKIFNNVFFYLVVGHNKDLYLKIYSLLENHLSRKHKFKLLNVVKNMPKIYSICDFAIGAAGVSAYERLMLGIPSIQIKAYNNQEYNYNEFLNSNLIIKLSNFSKINLLNAFSSLKEKKYKIFKLSFSLYCKNNYLFIYNLLFEN
ncbi:UDP-2,4-diacetamido-2,4,6-trideoxy-beta-L-altropyranose hydrolase, partial [Pelagibacteraceae bacterium]|nr:UDP-2,4-diacetamido-2,4,6-trideoxy-beta-L-altropyranose hydrolase [Pelagibacteraceae bacterium]